MKKLLNHTLNIIIIYLLFSASQKSFLFKEWAETIPDTFAAFELYYLVYAWITNYK